MLCNLFRGLRLWRTSRLRSSTEACATFFMYSTISSYRSACGGRKGGSRREVMCCGGVNTSRRGGLGCAGLLGQLRHVDITHDCGVFLSSAAGRGASGLVAQQKCGPRGQPNAVRPCSTPLVHGGSGEQSYGRGAHG